MDIKERDGFWKILSLIQDDSSDEIAALQSAIKVPDVLCRFRSLSENSLNQLQNNVLSYSSADHYDDPFDTFIHVDYNAIKEKYENIKECLNYDDNSLLSTLKGFEPIVGIKAEEFIDLLKKSQLELPQTLENIKHIRTKIQKSLFSICFCENSLNETLWIKYANNYKGFALEYDFNNLNTFLCGKEEKCKTCPSMIARPTIYPVCYRKDVYDATRYALALLLLEQRKSIPVEVITLCEKSIKWEAERISLIKKECHQYDEEWRLIRPFIMDRRTCIKMKPCRIILGLRMSEYEKLLVISAAKVAGIKDIEELYINDSDELDTRLYNQQ